jgi:tetratricopeptide (TPR) repeat protein
MVMKKYIGLLLLLLCLPMCAVAQSANVLLQQLSKEIAEQSWNDALKTFREMVGNDVSKADIYYRAELDKNLPVAIPFAEELATYYKNTRNYERAYNLYKELVGQRPNDLNILSGYAETAFGKGKEDEAITAYQKILSINKNDLRANIFLGSYYFMQAEQNKRQADNTFHRISAPNSMQKAHYKDGLKALYKSDYLKAKGYLDAVLTLFPSTEAKKMLDTIETRNKEINE